MTSDTVGFDFSARAGWQFSLSVEVMAYSLIIVAAILLRLLGLGDIPLSSSEAHPAVAALHFLAGQPAGQGEIDNILVFGAAALNFALASPTAAAGRFMPATAGIGLALSPVLFRARLGRVPTLLSVALIVLSPTAVTASRLMTGVGLAILAAVLSLKFLDIHIRTSARGAFVICGVMLAIATLADFATPLIVLAMALGLGFAVLTDEEGAFNRGTVALTLRSLSWNGFVVGFLVTLVAGATLFLSAPQGLGVAADQIAHFVSGIFNRPAGSPYAGLTLAIYEPFLLVFGLLGAWLASQSASPDLRFAAGWSVSAILLSLIYPGALPVHGLWCVVPLALMAALALRELIGMEHSAPWWAVVLHALTVAAALAMVLSHISHQLRAPTPLPVLSDILPGLTIQLDIVWLVVCGILLILPWLALASYWEPSAAWQGLGFGLALPAILLMLGQSGSLAWARATSPYEIINPAPANEGIVRLVQTAQDVSEIATGNQRDASVTIQGDESRLLAWSFRRFTSVSIVARLTPTVETVMVITPADGSSPFLGSSYVGQDFAVSSQWDVSSLNSTQTVSWLLYRDADPSTVTFQRVILWVRADVFSLVPQQPGP